MDGEALTSTIGGGRGETGVVLDEEAVAGDEEVDRPAPVRAPRKPRATVALIRSGTGAGESPLELVVVFALSSSLMVAEPLMGLEPARRRC